jgi:2-polyprenyl-3-methyl-5-hydroxy-6-metoxy-1,4-benzoquinol methylase
MNLDISKQELLTFWHSVMDPKGIGMAEAVAGEIATYTGESVPVVLSKMATGEKDLKGLWNQMSPDVSNPASVAKFYEEQFTEAYELAHWHSGGNGEPPLSYAYAAKFAQALGFKRVLDFGSGIGSGSLCFTAVGCEVHAADIAKRLLAFSESRVHARGSDILTIDLNKKRPLARYYDLVACFDVLEHLPNQLAKLRELSSYLRAGGYLLANLYEDSTDTEKPMHISSANNIVSMIRQTNLIPQWSNRPVDLQVLERSLYGRFWKHAASW